MDAGAAYVGEESPATVARASALRLEGVLNFALAALPHVADQAQGALFDLHHLPGAARRVGHAPRRAPRRVFLIRVC